MDSVDFTKDEKMKLRPSRKKCLFCYFLAIWIVGILLSYLFMGSKSNSFRVPDSLTYLEDQRSKKINLSDAVLKRFHAYCNPLSDHVHGDEGYSSDQLKLEFVSFMIRHGDRGPLTMSNNTTDKLCNLPLNFKHQYYDYVSKVSKANLSITSRAKSSSHAVLSDHCQPEQLSQVGAMQLIKLGSYLKGKYGAKLGFLTDPLPVNKLQVSFTPKERTFKSALAFLYGFAPSFFQKSQPFQINKADIQFCFEKSLCTCPLAAKLDDAISKETQKLVQSHPAIENLLAFINRVLNRRAKSIGPIVALDQLSLFICHQKYYPCSFTDSSCLSSEHIQRLMSYIEWSTAKLFDNQQYHTASRLKSQGFFIHLLQHIIEGVLPGKMEANNKPQILLYSGHDTNIQAVLMAMGHKITTVPPYASRLAFEVYSEKMGPKSVNYYIRILFNGKDITRYTTFCRQLWPKIVLSKDVADNIRCPLDAFIDFVNNSHLKMMNAKDFEEACKLPSNERK